jgi:hypothetical protein
MHGNLSIVDECAAGAQLSPESPKKKRSKKLAIGQLHTLVCRAIDESDCFCELVMDFVIAIEQAESERGYAFRLIAAAGRELKERASQRLRDLEEA